MNLTEQGVKHVNDVAARYNLSIDAVMAMLQAVVNGGGTMAQFSHPELGGAGQWMQGGMTMIGDMFNNALKAKVDQLCCELSNLTASQPLFAPAALAQSASGSGLAGFSNNVWWPSELGMPASSGAQNNLRYAIFPMSQRLAMEVDGKVTVYDTLNHQIGGVGQQQGSDASVTFSSQFGTVRLSDLPLVGASAPSAAVPEFQNLNTELSFSGSSADEADIFVKIERLAELRQRGILSDEEFAAKKTDLLSRL